MSTKLCNQGCGTEIIWKNDPTAPNGKGYFLDADTKERHKCPNWTGRTSSNTNTTSKPQQELKSQQFTKYEESTIEMAKTLSTISMQLTKIIEHTSDMALYTRKISSQLDNMNENERFLHTPKMQPRGILPKTANEDDGSDVYDEMADVDDATGMPEDR
jgi:hypothetical protein